MEVNEVPPPMPVAALGPLRVEMKLGNGQCHSKGCFEGVWVQEPCNTSLSRIFFSY